MGVVSRSGRNRQRAELDFNYCSDASKVRNLDFPAVNFSSLEDSFAL